MESLVIYISVFLIVSILLSFSEKNIKKNRKKIGYLMAIVALAIIIFISGFRYEVGTDYKTYINEYSRIATKEYSEISSERIEIGNIIIYKMLYVVSQEPQALIFSYSLISILIIYIAIKKFNYKNVTSMAFFIYMCVFIPFCYNGIRQGLAISIVLLAIAYLKEKKIWKFIISSLISVLVHTTAVIIIPFGIIIHCSKDKNIFKNIIVFTIIISFAIIFLPNILLKIDCFQRYYRYLSDISFENFSITPLILQIPVLACIFLFFRKNKNDRETLILIALTVAGIILESIATTAQYMNRLSLYLLISNIIMTPKLLSTINSKEKRLSFKLLYTIYFIAYFIIEFYIRGRHEIFPYQNIFFL